MEKKIEKVIIILAILLPSIVRILLFNLNRIHGDDILTAYFSNHYNFFQDNFFGPVPSNKADWVCQFPSLFFVLQKIFFLIFGANFLTIKLSVIPYVIIVSLAIFLITSRVFDKKTAVISVLLYAFFFPALYLETLGLLFISSTAVFMFFLYFLILFHQTKRGRYLITAAFFCALGYLFYSSSYLALGVLVLSFTLEFIFHKNRRFTIRNYLLSLVVFFLVLSPFIYNMIMSHNFYLAQRADQISLLQGEWSAQAKDIKSFSAGWTAFVTNFSLSLKSLYTSGLGGHGGYNFGHLAFFDPLTLSLFILGFFIYLWQIFKKGQLELVLLLVTIFASFLFGMALTISPPAFHRFSLAFPAIIIVISSFFNNILNLKINRFLKFAFASLLLIGYCFFNLRSFYLSVAPENQNENLRLAKLISTNYPRRNLYIASFPGYAFEKIFSFVEPAANRKVITDYHINLLNRFNSQEKYVYVIIFPESFYEKFQRKDKNGKIINFSNSFSIFVN